MQAIVPIAFAGGAAVVLYKYTVNAAAANHVDKITPTDPVRANKYKLRRKDRYSILPRRSHLAHAWVSGADRYQDFENTKDHMDNPKGFKAFGSNEEQVHTRIQQNRPRLHPKRTDLDPVIPVMINSANLAQAPGVY